MLHGSNVNSRNASVKITFYYPCLIVQLISCKDATVTCRETSFDYTETVVAYCFYVLWLRPVVHAITRHQSFPR